MTVPTANRGTAPYNGPMARMSLPASAEASEPVPDSPRSRLQAAKRQVTRQSLIDAAIEAFAEIGYARTTIDDIAVRAGLTRATFYKHFASKSALMPDLQSYIDARFDPLYRELAIIVAAPTVESVRDWILAAIEQWAELSAISKARNEAAALEPEVFDLVYYRQEIPAAKIAGALLAAGGAADVVPIQAVALLAPLEHFMKVLVQEGDIDRELIADVLAKTWVVGLKGPSIR